MSAASVIFMGTPEFAVPALKALHAQGFELPLVVTQPDRPKGRGRHAAPAPVKSTALALDLPVAQPGKVREPAFVERLKALKPDFLVVVAFGQILPEPVLKLAKYGAVNIHGSLLPKYRGPAPIQWAMLRGEQVTGVSTMLMERGVDTGDILLQSATPIDPAENAGQLRQRLAELGALLIVPTLRGLMDGTVLPQAQAHDQATYAPMLRKSDGHIHWHRPAQQLDRFVRAMTPWPGAFCFWNEKMLKVIQARPLEHCAVQLTPGTVMEGFPGELKVAAQPGAVLLEQIQPESSRPMSAELFLRGHSLKPGTVLT